MPKRKQPLSRIWTEAEQGGCQHISQLIYEELKNYAVDGQFYPLQHALYRYMAKPRYNEVSRTFDPAHYPDLTQGTFDYWFSRLHDAGLIEIDEYNSRAVRCTRLEIVEKEEPELMPPIHPMLDF